MSDTRIPSSIDGIKRHAKALNRDHGVPHQTALNLVAKQAGYDNFTHARHVLERSSGKPPTATPPPASGLSDFHQRTLAAWIAAVDLVDPAQAQTLIWSSSTEIIEALGPFMGRNFNHAHLPTGGGNDILRVQRSTEVGCLDLVLSERHIYRVRPDRLILERIASDPGESFLLLELANLAPSDVYEDEDDTHEDIARRLAYGQEEVVELAPGDFARRSIWDDGALGHDERGREIPLPDTARLVTRWFGGKILFVSKGSLWNGDPGTYDGRHNRAQSSDIRSVIERSLAPA